MRYLAHAVMHRGKIYRQSVVSLDNGVLTIAPFDRELHSTAFVSGIIVVVVSGRLTQSIRSRMEAIVRREELLEVAIRKASRYLDSSGLYVDNDDDEPALLIIER